MAWVWICTNKWTGAFDIDKSGAITTTPPIARWAKGKKFTAVVKGLFLSGQLVDFKVFGWKEWLDQPLDLDMVGG